MATQAMSEKLQQDVEIQFEGKSVKLPVHRGSEDEAGFDLAKLRSSTGLITFDPGYGNTGACKSSQATSRKLDFSASSSIG